jgi:hypothetical protein
MGRKLGCLEHKDKTCVKGLDRTQIGNIELCHRLKQNEREIMGAIIKALYHCFHRQNGLSKQLPNQSEALCRLNFLQNNKVVIECKLLRVGKVAIHAGNEAMIALPDHSCRGSWLIILR